jgi:hypothetical protein
MLIPKLAIFQASSQRRMFCALRAMSPLSRKNGGLRRCSCFRRLGTLHVRASWHLLSCLRDNCFLAAEQRLLLL